jgi:hypothetical protein
MYEDEDSWGREGVAPHILFVGALDEVCGQLNAAAALLSGGKKLECAAVA